MFKKIISLALCLCIGMSMTACKDSSDTTLTFSTGIDDSGFYEGINAEDYFKLPDGIMDYKIPKDAIEPSSEQTEGFIEYLKSLYGEKQDVFDRPAQYGDVVVIDYEGKIGNLSFTGGEAKDFELTLGSNMFVPGFEKGMEGHNIGDNFEIEVVFPDDYGIIEIDGEEIELGSKEAVFTVALKGIKEYVLTDDAISKAFEGIGTLEDGTPVTTLEQAKQYSIEQSRIGNAQNHLLNYLMENTETLKPIPQKIIDNRIDLEIQYMEMVAKQSDLKGAEELVQANGYESLDKFISENKIQIVMDIKRKMIFQQLAEKLDIDIDDEDIIEFCGSREDADAAVETYGLPYVKQSVLCDKVFMRILKSALE